VNEIENQDGEDHKQLTFTDQLSQAISDDNEASIGVMRDWLKEG
jgi:hypothetical protein